MEEKTRNTTAVNLVIVLLVLLITLSIATAPGIAAKIEPNRNVVTLYDDGSIRVIERAGNVICFQDGHAVDCISRGLKKRQ